jgi:glutamine phosphoribosylpyrophosphate amidotransferase
MCNICGSTSLEKAHQLYVEGLERGSFASGFLVFTKNHFRLFKQENPFELDYLQKEIKQSLDEFGIYYLFHSRAPTNSKQPHFDYTTTHPFNFGFNFVAHNGIIQNFTEFPNHQEFNVDSSIIPYHLYTNKGDIVKTYSAYKGLLTSWIYTTEKLYLVKAGSSLHMDQDSFSSTSFEGSHIIEEDGIVYEFNGLKFDQINTFPYENPYFLL